MRQLYAFAVMVLLAPLYVLAAWGICYVIHLIVEWVRRMSR